MPCFYGKAKIIYTNANFKSHKLYFGSINDRMILVVYIINSPNYSKIIGPKEFVEFPFSLGMVTEIEYQMEQYFKIIICIDDMTDLSSPYYEKWFCNQKNHHYNAFL